LQQAVNRTKTGETQGGRRAWESLPGSYTGRRGGHNALKKSKKGLPVIREKPSVRIVAFLLKVNCGEILGVMSAGRKVVEYGSHSSDPDLDHVNREGTINQDGKRGVKRGCSGSGKNDPQREASKTAPGIYLSLGKVEGGQKKRKTRKVRGAEVNPGQNRSGQSG